MATFESKFDEKQLVITVLERFLFDDREKFRETYEHIPNFEELDVTVDLINTQFLDSTALEMLLILRECCIDGKGKITLKIKGNKDIEKIIHIANFEKIFNIT